MKQKIWVILCCAGLLFLMGWWLWSAFHIQRDKLCAESSLVFADVLQREKIVKIEREFGNYNPNKSPNNISGAEKAEWCDQDFLFSRDSTRAFLDSLFRRTLLEHNVHAKTAIRCVRKGRVIDTSSDSTFYKEALPLRLFTYRIDENPDKDIILQAYIKLPFITVWKHSYLTWMILGLELLLLAAVILGIYFWNRKIDQINKQDLELQQEKQKQELQRIELQRLQQLQKKAERLPSLFIQNKTIKWIELSQDLLFDEEHGDLCYRNEVNIRLTENSLKLFRCFIKVEQNKLTSDKICMEVLGRSVKNELSKSDRDAVANTIRHLRAHLSLLPFIEIKPIRGTGYEMIILSPENSSETTTDSE